ncbi:hypothetical protein [Clostridium sp. LIBA-8841]|uniref:hypothetical protein n=1 Tax=Clostridium sp. LIBA-8841 TaxID=2987530 RepID=UPI002AC59D86|nr:hypothetical protein [Clostridium sp. LIBA-8841]MDZ5252735.1 hypothetical protein [Clostridium sp. LIBA-8841]
MKRVKIKDVMSIFKNVLLGNKRNIFLICLLSYFILYVLSIGSIKIANLIFNLFVIALTIVIDCGVIASIDKCSKEDIKLSFKDIFIFSKSKLKLGLFWYILIAFLNSMLGVVIAALPFKPTIMVLSLLYFSITAIITPLMIISISGHTIVNKKNYIYVIFAMIFIIWVNFLPFVGEILNFLIKPFIILYLISLSEAEKKAINNL